MPAARLAGPFSVDASARLVRQYRYGEERLMRILAGWIALTPELPAKLLLGRHVWDCAQHADLWGKRLPELRAGAHESEPASDAFVHFMTLLESPGAPHQTVERLVGVYRVLKPHLVAAYARHLATANPVYEPPTRRILERCVTDERRHVGAGAVVLDRLLRPPATRPRAEAWERTLLDALAAAGGVTGHGAETAVADGPAPAVAQDLVALDSTFSGDVTPPALASRLDEHRRALLAGDISRAAEDATAAAREEVRAEYARLGSGFTTCEVVALARIGEYRIAKLRLAGGALASIVQLEWRPLGDTWQLFAVQLVQSGCLP